MTKYRDDWRRIREQTIQALDIRATYEEWGIVFTGAVKNNWAACSAIGREDKNPSAGVNLETGHYKDFGGESLGIFDFATKFGPFDDWQTAQRELAKVAGLGKKLPRKSNPPKDRGIDRCEIRNWQPVSVLGLCKRIGCGVTPEILRLPA